MSVYLPVIAAAVLGGASAGALGAVVVGLRMPFLAVFTAHAALAGALVADLFELPQRPVAFAAALLGALALARLMQDRDLDPNAALGTLFSLALGIAFLAMGLSPGPRAGALGLLWGSLLFVGRSQVTAIAVAGIVLAATLVVFDREIRALLFSRGLARHLVAAGPLTVVLMVAAAGVISVNLETVGGLFLYSLVTSPAVAAARLARSYRGAVLGAAALGAASALAGFAAAWRFDLPVGACIVIAASLVVGGVLAGTRGRDHGGRQ